MTLAELLRRAGCVRAMELDINTWWISLTVFMPNGHGGLQSSNLLPSMVRPADRYLSAALATSSNRRAALSTELFSRFRAGQSLDRFSRLLDGVDTSACGARAGRSLPELPRGSSRYLSRMLVGKSSPTSASTSSPPGFTGTSTSSGSPRTTLATSASGAQWTTYHRDAAREGFAPDGRQRQKQYASSGRRRRSTATSSLNRCSSGGGSSSRPRTTPSMRGSIERVRRVEEAPRATGARILASVRKCRPGRDHEHARRRRRRRVASTRSEWSSRPSTSCSRSTLDWSPRRFRARRRRGFRSLGAEPAAALTLSSASSSSRSAAASATAGITTDASSRSPFLLRVSAHPARTPCRPTRRRVLAPPGAVVATDGSLFLASGNSSSSGAYDYGNSVVHLSSDLRLLDSFAPRNWVELMQEMSTSALRAPCSCRTAGCFRSGRRGRLSARHRASRRDRRRAVLGHGV